MRMNRLAFASLLAALSACGRHADHAARTGAGGGGLRRDGLWRQTVYRDGKALAFGRMRACVDRATDARMTLIGHALGGSGCTRSTWLAADGSHGFRMMCDLGRRGLMTSTGQVWSDFATTYRLHAESEITGSRFPPLNGSHVTEITASYLGPCPSDMVPGEVIVGPGLKVNLNRLPSLAAAALG